MVHRLAIGSLAAISLTCACGQTSSDAMNGNGGGSGGAESWVGTGGAPPSDAGADTGSAGSTAGGPSGGAGGTATTGNASCDGLAKTCGPKGDDDCCASREVPGIPSATFLRSYDGVTPDFMSKAYPATVSDFRLDRYEVTVGRFRKFVAAYSQTMIQPGAGANPNDAADRGWDSASNAKLPLDRAALIQSVSCNATYQTWTDEPGDAASESRPIDCLEWYVAEAFCIWDGGRLPTEAEWNYAAAGGTEQRVYPWGRAPVDCTYANAFSGADYCVLPGIGGTNRVGSESPKGDGRFGQADLAGNVWEWTQDYYAKPYANPCLDCADLTPTSLRSIRGGGYFDSAFADLASFRGAAGPTDHYYLTDVGARCARNP